MRDDAKIRQQLLLEKALLKYRYGRASDDAYLTDWLVKYLGDNGVTDLRHLTDVHTSYVNTDLIGGDAQTPGPMYGQTIDVHTLTDATTGRAIEFIGVGLPGEYQAIFETVFTTDGTPFFTARVWYNPGGVLKQFQMAAAPVLPVIMVAMAVLIPGAGAALAESVFGSGFAAAYPTLASAVGNVAINTAFNGGNVESAVKGVALSSVGGVAGGAVGGATESALLGSVTNSAVSAMLAGGDVAQAVAFSLAGTGARNMGDYLDLSMLTPSPAPVDFTVPPFGAADPFGVSPAPVSDPLSTLPNDQIAPIVAAVQNPASPFMLADFGNAANAAGGPGFTVPPLDTSAGSPTTTDAAGVNWGAVAATVSQIAIAAIKVIPAYLNAGKPALQMGATRTAANGSTTTVSADGTITVRAANGASSTRPIPAGTPYLLPDASLVTNNGDGTYTRVSSSGQVTMAKYPAASAGGGNLMMLAAIGAGAFLLMR